MSRRDEHGGSGEGIGSMTGRNRTGNRKGTQMGATQARRGRVPGGNTARKVGVAALVTALLAALGMVVPPILGVGAQKVGNPGNVNFKIAGGNIALGSQSFDLEPSATTECNDAKNNDGKEGDPAENVQDLLVDFPADPQCTSLDDNSEVQSGFQPKQDTVISGTVTGAGAVSVPQSGIFFPPIYQYQSGAVLTVQVQPTAAGTGNINPLTGAAALTISLRISITGSPQGVSLGSGCGVGPFTLAMTTGTTNPPAPNTPITGVPYDETTGRGTVVNNSFSVPGASGCGPLGLANSQLNTGLGVPAAAGTNTAILVLESTPKIQKGVRASNVPSALSGSAPLTVNFNGTASTAVKAPISYAWDFGNGQTATGATGSTVYSTPGTYTATLTVTDGDGDTDTQTRTITVTEPPNVLPTAAIAASGTSGITPYAVTFSGAGSVDPDGTIASYAWDFGNGQTATGVSPSAVTYTTPGTYTATLTVTDNRGGIGTATQTVTVLPVPNVLPVASAKVVSIAGTIPLTVNLSGADSVDPDGTIVSYAWDFGNGQTGSGVTTQAVYDAAGTYVATLTVTDNSGGTATSSVNIDVSADPNIAPSADLQASTTSGTAPLSVSLDGSGSVDLDGTIASYAWNFGNGQNGSGPTPSVTYTLPGTYTVTLVVTDNRGATGTATRQIVVSRPPNQSPVANASATPASGVAPLLVQLSSAGSSDTDGAITGYAWNFGNGLTSTSPNPSAVYSTAGTYTVLLTVTDNDGATAVKSLTVTVAPPNQPPVPSIAASSVTGAAPLSVSVNGAGSSDPDGSIVSYAWDFGNGQTATGPLASTTYTAQGSYQIRLTVTDNRGTSRTAITTVVAGPPNVRPVAAITALPTAGPAPLLVQLNSVGSTDPDGTIVSYAWDFGNGQSATGSSTQVTYTQAGTYTVTLTVTDNRGAKTSATEQIVVDPPQPVRDRVRLQFTGARTYSFDGPVTAGNLLIVSDQFGPQSVSGSADYGVSGTVTVSLSRFLWFNAYIGTVTVNDPGAGLANVASTMVLGSLSRPSATSVRGQAAGFTPQFQQYNLSFTIDDRV